MNIPADQFFACSALPINQHAAVGRSDNGDLLAHRFNGNAFAHDVETVFQLAPQQIVGLLQPAVRQRVAGDEQDVLQG